MVSTVGTGRQQRVLGEKTDEGSENGKWAEVDDL
jgi:hypothetical protein